MAKHYSTFILTAVINLIIPSSNSWAPKRNIEDINYMYSPTKYTFQPETEPSCEELRAIWRLTKRAAQQSILTNEIHNPGAHFGYMVKTPSILDVKPSRGLKPKQSYGKVLIQPHPAPPGAAYDEVAKKLKTDTIRGRNWQPSSIVYAPLDPDYDYAAVKTGNTWGKSKERSFHDDYEKDDFGMYQMAESTDNQLNSCRDIANNKCHRDSDCDCFDDVYTCVKGRCRSKTIRGKVKFNTWDDSNNTNQWSKNTPPLTPNNLKNKAWRKNLRRTDRKNFASQQDYYAKKNPWT